MARDLRQAGLACIQDTQEATGETGHQGPGRTGTWEAFGPWASNGAVGEVTPDPSPQAWGSLKGGRVPESTAGNPAPCPQIQSVEALEPHQS